MKQALAVFSLSSLVSCHDETSVEPCATDTQCKGDRICVDGACQNPTGTGGSTSGGILPGSGGSGGTGSVTVTSATSVSSSTGPADPCEPEAISPAGEQADLSTQCQIDGENASVFRLDVASTAGVGIYAASDSFVPILRVLTWDGVELGFEGTPLGETGAWYRGFFAPGSYKVVVQAEQANDVGAFSLSLGAFVGVCGDAWVMPGVVINPVFSLPQCESGVGSAYEYYDAEVVAGQTLSIAATGSMPGVKPSLLLLDWITGIPLSGVTYTPLPNGMSATYTAPVAGLVAMQVTNEMSEPFAPYTLAIE
jgi:hypothetical protein